MARSWKVYDNWEAGGFFAGGSFDAVERFTSVNMQRYQNGSIGPRPGWRKRELSVALSGATLASVADADKYKMQYGFGWSNDTEGVAPTTHTTGQFLHATPTHGTALGRRYAPVPATNTINVYALTDLVYSPALGASPTPAAYQINDYRPRIGQGSGFVEIGTVVYRSSTNAITEVSAGVGPGAAIRPTQLTFHKGRIYGHVLTVLFGSDAASLLAFNTGDAFAFQLGGAGLGGSDNYFDVRGIWPLPNGLLIYCGTGPTSSYTQYETPDGTGRGVEVGQWFMLTGTSPTNGTLTPLGRDAGPLFRSLAIVHDDKLLFPIYQRGWAVHDGTRVDKTSLADLRPGRGQYAVGALWHNPVRTVVKSSLVLPFTTTVVDPTAEGSGTADRIGEYYNLGHGAYEFINGSWTEHLYLHGQGDIVGYCNFEEDKLACMHLDSPDGGANWTPVIYTRDTTLDRPATTSSQNTYNPASDGTETAPTQAGGATGNMVHQLTTGEALVPGFGSTKVLSVVIDYDYWNSDLFAEDCGFDVTLIYRGGRQLEKQEVQVNDQRVTPPGTSIDAYSKRARATLNLGARVEAGSFQVKIHNLIGCAIHSIAVAHEPNEQVR